MSALESMFTGIIEELGRVRAIERRGEDARIVIEARAVTEGSRDGESISVNGVCLTALEVTPDSFAADVSKETLFRSTLDGLQPGSPVNLERAVTPATRLGGHIVQGHVDACGVFVSSENHGDSWTFRFAYPKNLSRYLVLKGSIAVDGVSLTIANLTDDYFEIAVIPKTLELTNFSHLKRSDLVNLEADVIAKYVERTLTLPNSNEDLVEDRNPPLHRSLLALVAILIAISANWYLFRLFHVPYFTWYLRNGPIISLAVGFLGPTWTKMKARLGLISANPALYIGSCFQVVGVLVYSLAGLRGSRKALRKTSAPDMGLNGLFARALDTIIYPLLQLAITVLSLAWLATVAPIAYLVTLVAGVPAREALRGRISATYISEGEGQVNIGRGENVSFARDPFAITQAVSSLLLFTASIIYFRFA